MGSWFDVARNENCLGENKKCIFSFYFLIFLQPQDHRPFSSDKISTLEEFVNFVTDLDTQNATIISAFTFSSDKKSAAQIIAGAQPVSCVFGDVSSISHVVFVVDVSGSMSTVMTDPDGRRVTRLQFVVEQLIMILTRSLAPTQYFNLAAFSSRTSTWSPGVVPATPANVALAVSWAQQLSAGGSTAMWQALNVATSDPLAVGVVLLSDGEPDCCQAQMISLASMWSGGVRIVNTILLEAGGSAQPKASSFMCQLAAAGSGVCRTNA